MIEQMEEAEKYNPDVYKEDKMSLLSEKPGPGDEGR